MSRRVVCAGLIVAGQLGLIAGVIALGRFEIRGSSGITRLGWTSGPDPNWRTTEYIYGFPVPWGKRHHFTNAARQVNGWEWGMINPLVPAAAGVIALAAPVAVVGSLFRVRRRRLVRWSWVILFLGIGGLVTAGVEAALANRVDLRSMSQALGLSVANRNSLSRIQQEWVYPAQMWYWGLKLPLTGWFYIKATAAGMVIGLLVGLTLFRPWRRSALSLFPTPDAPAVAQP